MGILGVGYYFETRPINWNKDFVCSQGIFISGVLDTYYFSRSLHLAFLEVSLSKVLTKDEDWVGFMPFRYLKF